MHVSLLVYIYNIRFSVLMVESPSDEIYSLCPRCYPRFSTKKEAAPVSETLRYASNAKSRNSVIVWLKPVECIQMDNIQYLGSEKAWLLTVKLGM